MVPENIHTPTTEGIGHSGGVGGGGGKDPGNSGGEGDWTIDLVSSVLLTYLVDLSHEKVVA